MTGCANEAGEPDLYAIPVLDQWLVLSPQTWTVAMVNRSAVAALARFAEGSSQGLPNELQALWRRLTRNAPTLPPPDEGPDKLVVLQPRACNMRCVYCDFDAAQAAPGILDPRQACRLADCFARRLRKRGERTLRVHFFGGEPLVAWFCTETIVHYVRSLCARMDLVPWFELTTNGDFDPSLIPFVGDYIDSVVVSLDGPESVHDFNRRSPDGGGTYARIAANLHRLASYPAHLCLRMCVTNRSVDAMADVAAGFCREFDFEVLSFEALAENACSRRAGLSAPDPFAFAAGLLRAETLAAQEGVRIVHGPSELTGPRISSCPLGRGTWMLGPGGEIAACYLDPERWQARGLDLALGRVDAAGGVSIDQRKADEVAALVRAKPRCVRCFCRHTCAGGCHVDQTPPGCSPAYDQRCLAIRAITASRLLRRLGDEAAVELLAGRRTALESIARHPDDRLAFGQGTP